MTMVSMVVALAMLAWGIQWFAPCSLGPVDDVIPEYPLPDAAVLRPQAQGTGPPRARTRGGRPVCYFWHQTGMCEFETCEFAHEDPAFFDIGYPAF